MEIKTMSKRKNRRKAKKTYQQTEIKQPNYENGSILADDEKREEEELLEQTEDNTFNYTTEDIEMEYRCIVKDEKLTVIETLVAFFTFLILNNIKIFLILPLFLVVDFNINFWDKLAEFSKNRYGMILGFEFWNEVKFKMQEIKLKASLKKPTL